MSDSALLFRPPSKWPMVAALAGAVMIHLGAVALASHRLAPASDFISPPSTEITVIDEGDSTPVSPQFDVPEPPSPPLLATEFVEDRPPLPAPRSRDPRPLRAPTKARSAHPYNARALALHAPRPEYPYEARSRHITGSGVAALWVDEASGAVIDAEMEQSIGSSILDQSALTALRRWRFRSGTPPRVRVPVTFTMTGAQL
jgi:periplasmic protein TonB